MAMDPRMAARGRAPQNQGKPGIRGAMGRARSGGQRIDPRVLQLLMKQMQNRGAGMPNGGGMPQGGPGLQAPPIGAPSGGMPMPPMQQ